MLKRSVLVNLLLLSLPNVVFGYNIAYVEVNANNPAVVQCYRKTTDGTPFFDSVAMMGANVNGTDPNNPQIFFNPAISHILNETNVVQQLQAQHIKVILSIIGNHQDAGWSCTTTEQAAQNFAEKVVAVANQYHVDGIDIDDEYTENCVTNNTSLINIAAAIKSNPNFQGKILSKDLGGDQEYFQVKKNGKTLANYLDYGYEMTYEDPDFSGRAAFYLKHGFTTKNLSVGGWTKIEDVSPLSLGAYLKLHEYAGGMIYDVDMNSLDYLQQFSEGFQKSPITFDQNCGHFYQ